MFNKGIRVIVILAVGVLLFLPSPASAHHEAMFGPQSSAVLSPGMFISLQMFDRENGVGGYRHRETTGVYSLGYKPFLTNPLSFAFVGANTREAYTGVGSTTLFEDPLVSARYRVNAPGVAKRLGVQESYVMGVGGLELPFGNKDHAAGHGPIGEIAAGLFSIEKRPIAAIAYGYYHHAGEYNGMVGQVADSFFPITKQNGNFFTGGGVAYTPIDDDAKGHLFSMQLGLSYEKTFAMENLGQPIPATAADATMIHPGLVFQTNPRFQYFALVSLPLSQQYGSPDYRQLFRLGFGTIIMLGHSGEAKK